ncbi:MAG TPA: hypothetical protein PKY66_16315 [Thermoflexales bacterium]|nr:hypothetical protein [Thermoflexales bacterium]
MTHTTRPIFIGETQQQQAQQDVSGEYVALLGDTFYKIRNYDAMPPFFMSVVSSSNHWLFISSTGGLSAGRVSAEQALFPYYTDDKLTESGEHTGPKAILLATRAGRTSLWEPFSTRQRGIYTLERNLYKNVAGTALVFEEINHSLGLVYRYAWRSSDAFGFVKTSWLLNMGASACAIELLDGLQNLLPANISPNTQNEFSPLLDAYKRAEVDAATGLAVFSLNSTLTDLAEPSESLLATTVVQLGLEGADYLISSSQLDSFRSGRGVTPEVETRGKRGAYFARATFDLVPGAERSWHLIAEVSQDSAAIVRLSRRLRGDRPGLIAEIERDIEAGTAALKNLVASADGLQTSGSALTDARHFANVMFNCMRGGVFFDPYQIDAKDFIAFIAGRNRAVLAAHPAFFAALPPTLGIAELHARAEEVGAPDLIRLTYAYLPLSFSRRHGDPSRPWNRFAIRVKNPDGTRRLDYEGNWRDIFQNWEALAWSYPEYIEGMVSTFVNATTVDGYNPYRITRQGIDWEIPEPNNPWANIGYWSDHQIIYLQKLMEVSARLHPGKLKEFLAQPLFSYANVPYRIKPYADLLKDSASTIDFDWKVEHEIEARVKARGSDGKLLSGPDGEVLHVTLTEKLLTLLLAKVVNLVPEGGIWMNTQRPEWNDANNALVGKGLSVVTLGYLRRYIAFFKDLLIQNGASAVPVSAEVRTLFTGISNVLSQFQGTLIGAFSDAHRRAMMDGLGQAGGAFRATVYAAGLTGAVTPVPVAELLAFLDLAQQHVEHALRANKRDDGLYHAYNILHLSDGRASIAHLYEMLEGQVAILSSGLLSGAESVALLDSLRHGPLYRADQHTYILYPDRALPGLLERNRMTAAQVGELALVNALLEEGDGSLFVHDEDGHYHFSGHIRNVKGVTAALEALKRQPRYTALVEAEAAKIETLFETVFRHSEFTGRSGTFFAYEGLGSVYWHMVSKLLLAVQETAQRARNEPAAAKLLAHYADIRLGLSFNKTPDAYGAFPTDPYSHTPKGQGAKQPGMTGMVKEEILTRQAELGYTVINGALTFDFLLLSRGEFASAPATFNYIAVDGKPAQLALRAGSLAYTIAQVPVILEASGEACAQIHFSDGTTRRVEGHALDSATSRHLFERDGVIHHLVVEVAPNL